MTFGEPWSIPEPEHGGEFVVAGVTYKGTAEYVWELLGFCGCGDPDAALAYVADTLAKFALPEGSYDAIAAQFDGSGIPDGLSYFYLYRLDDLELIEHGSNIRGSWLTERGKNLLGVLLRICKEES